MQTIITLDVLCATSDQGFSLDELVFRTQELFLTEGLPGVVSLILQLVDEKLSIDMMQGRTNSDPCACCSQPAYVSHDRPSRRFRTSVGDVSLRWRRVKCTRCGKTHIPLQRFLGLEPYQSKTAELEKLVTEIVSEQSYRRSSDHLNRIGRIPVPKSTAHRWVVQSECDQLDSGHETLDVLFADGTGYKRRPNPDAGITNRGELRIALGVDKKGRIVPLGAFSGQDWETIAAVVQSHVAEGKPVADILVSDGERGLIQSLGRLCNDQQRSHWHLVRDLNHTMWQNDAGKPERRHAQKHLAAIIGIELPEEDFERIREEDKEHLDQAVTEAECDIRKLITRLLDKGYQVAADYLIRACKNIFGYVRRWLETGIVTPRVSSMIERMMRELARRLKRMAFGWSEQGAAKMARIIIKRFTSAGQWEKYWREKLRIDDNVMLVLKTIKVKNPQTLGR